MSRLGTTPGTALAIYEKVVYKACADLCGSIAIPFTFGEKAATQN